MDGCQHGITSLISTLVDTANKIDNRHDLRTRVSDLAQSLGNFSNQKRNLQKSGTSMGSRANCLRAMNDLHQKLQQIALELRSSKGKNADAAYSLDKAIELVESMMERRQAH
ncbi:hypothetical protein X798_01014 [Onchocerca flexuosa]|uniref:Uncharacterized protein n=1 Tax=Onchocerca flexuosa TaxID=387005 RepID=A0A238C304_9BILA|nr:hypothetical protein X798_01014 [Onchocerca flexuosa]